MSNGQFVVLWLAILNAIAAVIVGQMLLAAGLALVVHQMAHHFAKDS